MLYQQRRKEKSRRRERTGNPGALTVGSETASESKEQNSIRSSLFRKVRNTKTTQLPNSASFHPAFNLVSRRFELRKKFTQSKSRGDLIFETEHLEKQQQKENGSTYR
jgi:hypothetical protein